MTAGYDRPQTPGNAVFEWHPNYKGTRLKELTQELEADIARDQRAYELALAGAEESEHDAFSSVVDLERQWSMYSFAWHEEDPAMLARRIADFEWEREQRREMISWNDYRGIAATQPRGARNTGDWRASISDEQRRKVANIGAGIVVALIVVVLIAIIAVVVM